MPEFTVEAARQVKSGIGRDNNMQVIALGLSDGTTVHEAEWFTSDATPLPQPGSRGEWILEPGQYGLKAKKPRGSGGGGGGGKSPQEQARIMRQHSQEMAIRVLTAKLSAGVVKDFTKEHVAALANWFDDDIAAGVERKHPSQRMVNGLPVHNEPQQTGAPEVTTPSPDYTQAGTVPTGDEDIPFAPSVF